MSTFNVYDADMTGIIPEEDYEEQEMYDDVGPTTAESAPIDEDIYEELPGSTTKLLCLQNLITVSISDGLQNMNTWLVPS